MVKTIIQEKWREWKCSAVKGDPVSLMVVCSYQDVSPFTVSCSFALWGKKSTGDSKYSDSGNH